MKTLRKPIHSRRDLPDLLDGKTICLVDDDSKQHDILQRLLADTEVTLHFFEEAPKALTFLLANPVDLILCDIMMPGLDGWELHAALRHAGDNRSTPVIFTTCLISQSQEEVMADPQHRCLTIAKPLSRAGLARAVERLF